MPRGYRVSGHGSAREGGTIEKPKRFRAILVALVALGVAAAAWYQFRKIGFEWQEFVRSLARLDGRWLAASAALALATYYGRALRWAVMLRPLRPHPSLWNLFKATAIGFTAIVLFGRAGEFVRPYLIATKEDVPVTSQLAAWVLERVYDLIMALLIFGFALGQIRKAEVAVGPALQWTFQVGGWVVFVVCSLCLLFLVLLRTHTDVLRRRLLDSLGFLHHHHLTRIEKLLSSFLLGVESAKSGAAVAQVVAYTVLEWVLIAACYVCIMKSFSGIRDFTLLDILIFMGFVAFGAVVQLPGIGGGVQVVAVVVLHELFGVPLEAASGMAVAVWAITFIVVVPVGLPLAFYEGLNWKKLKSLGQDLD